MCACVCSKQDPETLNINRLQLIVPLHVGVAGYLMKITLDLSMPGILSCLGLRRSAVDQLSRSLQATSNALGRAFTEISTSVSIRGFGSRVEEEAEPAEVYEPPFHSPSQLIHVKGSALLQDAWFNKASAIFAKNVFTRGDESRPKFRPLPCITMPNASTAAQHHAHTYCMDA